jgi:hypothetical protein
MSRLPWALCAGAALAVGVALRVFAIREQVVCDDELFTLRSTLVLSYLQVFSTYQHAYHSIPHTLTLQLLADAVGLDELTLRLPSLVAGIGLLLVAPWVVWRRFGPAAAALFAVLLALSPALVFYSRLARSYAFAIALVFLAVMALERWISTRRPGAALTYVGLAIAAIWFHQIAAPAVLAPLGAAALLAARGSAPGRRGAAFAAPLYLGGAVALLSLVLQWDAFLGSHGRLIHKAGTAALEWPTLRGAGELLAGSARPWLAGAVWSGVALGCALALRRHTAAAVLLLASVLAQLLTVWLLAPYLAELPRVFARYVACVLPFVLLFLALLVAELSRLRVAGRDWPLPLFAGVGLAALLYAFGFVPATYYRPSNFTTHVVFHDRPLEPEAPPLEVPSFYARLAQEPGDFSIVEAPWQNAPDLIPFHAYQRVHGKRVRIGFLGSLGGPPNPDEFPLSDPLVRFRTFVDAGDLSALRAAGARYLVLHLDLAAEQAERGRPELALDLAPVVAELIRRLGPPAFEDGRTAVFALPREQSGAAAPAGRARG